MIADAVVPAWVQIVVALITASSVLGAVILTNRRMKRIEGSTEQINRAVNHVNPGEPTLIQRVKHNEEEQRVFRIWTMKAMQAIGSQVGVNLPPAPKQTSQSETHYNPPE